MAQHIRRMSGMFTGDHGGGKGGWVSVREQISVGRVYIQASYHNDSGFSFTVEEALAFASQIKVTAERVKKNSEETK